MQKLVEGAKKEGKLNIYTSAQTDDMGALVAGFEKKYGIKVNVWRAAREKVLQRAVTEARGNRAHGRHRRDQRPRARVDAPREGPAGRQVAAPEGPHRAGDPPARRMGRHAAQRLRAGVQHQPGEEGRAAQDLGGPRQPELEGQARHRAGGRRLARRRSRRAGRGAGRRRSSTTSSPPTASRCARATRCSPSWWSRARSRSRSRSTTTRPSSSRRRARRSTGSRSARRSRGPTASASRATRRTRTPRCSSTTSRSARKARRSSPGATSCRPTRRSTRRSARSR